MEVEAELCGLFHTFNSKKVTKEEIKIEVSHIFDSGANEIRVTEMVERFVKRAEKEVRHRAAEIVAGANSKDDADRDIMNISILA
jgi:hypothetical protein